MLIIVLPIAIGLSVLSRDIVLSIYKADFLPSVLPLKILMVSLIFSFLSFPVGAFLNACNKQNQQTILVFCILVLNVILNLILIPMYSVVGATISAAVGNILLTVVGYILIQKIVPLPNRLLFKDSGLLFFSAAVMGLVVWAVNVKWHYLLAIPAGALTYALMLFLTRSITKNQIIEAIGLLKK